MKQAQYWNLFNVASDQWLILFLLDCFRVSKFVHTYKIQACPLGHYALFFEVLNAHPIVSAEALCGICGEIKQLFIREYFELQFSLN